MITTLDAQGFAKALRDHLSPDDVLFVALQMSRHTARWATLMSAHGGERHDARSLAALCLQLAKRCAAEKGGPS